MDYGLEVGNSPTPLFFVSDRNKGLEVDVFSITFEVMEIRDLASRRIFDREEAGCVEKPIPARS